MDSIDTNISDIYFIPEYHSEDFCNGTEVLILIPSDIKDKEDLFQVYSEKLLLPGYFGKNWDALDECIGDLNWLNYKRIILMHTDWPLYSDKNVYKTGETNKDIYIGVLSHAIAKNKANPDTNLSKEVIVFFPLEYKKEINKIYRGKMHLLIPVYQDFYKKI
ncbi:MAG: hypothetical protein A2986_00860 [Candidatus Jacksonbacteria bacterium RIFCSPLOWO2_01_FULL_44_13]|uniref:Barstar (barnase inhibitor) domain-containing protein n=1 Tax=candidate division CPR1 bacterium GW2011_GWA2_42_17 TaxID=1618341 RepID=A0A0G1BD87_9BACT|nr:MAG: hypothetical protein UV05_C0007G0016 [candidate division CPR1 bacterium GW2011_GWA2_42_17]OGY71013.1 MAG: hypothetical protein A2986_00860 [Candidatus Jacksonbacteria bacterium RIFCSPLOWO2_01_FULL_44_13]